MDTEQARGGPEDEVQVVEEPLVLPGQLDLFEEDEIKPAMRWSDLFGIDPSFEEAE